MKINIILKVSLIAAIVFFCSCDNFLDIKPKGKDVPETIAHYNGLFNNNTLINFNYVTGYDNGIQEMGMGALYHPYMSDEFMATAESFENMDAIERLAYQWTEDIFINDAVSAEWIGCYQHNYICNIVANNVMDAPDGSELEKRQLLAEARATRAFLHMLLVQWFGKPYDKATASTDLAIPIVTEANSMQTNFKRESIEKVYDFIITELEEACPDLKAGITHRLRMSQPAGYTFLGKAYMLTGEWDKAVAAFESAFGRLSGGSLTLDLFDYNTMVNKWGYNSAAPYAWMFGYPNLFRAENNEVGFCKQFSIMNITPAGTEPILYIKPEYIELYQPEDHRLKFFSNMNYTGVIQYPYYIKQMIRMNVNIGMDVSDLYLMYAEALARSGNEENAREILLTFRRHRIESGSEAIPASVVTRDDLIRFIVEERLREYMGMGNRWFDIRRLWNDPLFTDLKTKCVHPVGGQTYTLTEERLTYPIPASVMNLNPSWIQQ